MKSIEGKRCLLALAAHLLLAASPALANSIVDSLHNLSVSGPGEVRATAQTEICIFCHTPHNARPDIPYLWNRSDPAGPYTPYYSSTLKAVVGQPTGTSRLCLSCHDGTIAPGAVLSQAAAMPFTATMTGRSSNLGTNLTDDHPVSFDYAAPSALNGELAAVGLLPPAVRLDESGQMQCTACHDPHSDQYAKFLVASSLKSGLCLACHLRGEWGASSHAVSAKTWNGAGTDPWPNSSYTTTADNGCANCHRPHTAGEPERLLNYAVEETNCLACHNGNVAGKNLSADFLKAYRHPIASYNGIHDPAESYAGPVSKHVTCADCHNPHKLDSTAYPAPQIPGRLRGVRGVDFYTNAPLPSSSYEYQICFKCHGDLSNNVLTSAQPITRYWTNTRDNRVKFDPANVSFHPLLAPLNKISANMLVSPWAIGSLLYCTDCHGSDSGAIRGSHGSIYPHILVAKYETSAVSPVSATAYLTDSALCFKCHNASTLFGALTKFPQHKRHLTVGTMERCSYCHDPHGNPTNPGMINFDMRPGIVTLSGGKPIQLNYPLSTRQTCVLTCHGVVHGS